MCPCIASANLLLWFFWSNRNTVLAFRSRATFLHASMIFYLFVSLNDHGIEETISFKMLQDFLRQIFVTTFPSQHDADHHSTARFHECNTWLSFALCPCSNEHAACLDFRQRIRCLVHHNSSVRKTSLMSRNTDRAPISEWNVWRVVSHSHSICGRFRRTKYSYSFRLTRNVNLPGLICIGDCSSITSWSFSSFISIVSSFVVDYVHVICRTLTSHHQRFARRNSNRQNDVQIGILIVRYQIHCLVSKKDTILNLIAYYCHATMFQCRSVQERFEHVHHVKCDLDQDSFSTLSSRARTPLCP